MSELERAREIKSAELALIQEEMQLDEVGSKPRGNADWHMQGQDQNQGLKLKVTLGSRCDLGWVTCPFQAFDSLSVMRERGPGFVRLK